MQGFQGLGIVFRMSRSWRAGIAVAFMGPFTWGGCSRLAGAGAGRLEGTVRLKAVPPPAPALATTESVARTCGASVPDESLVTSTGGGLKDAVVFLASPRVLGPEKVLPSATVDQRGCRYSPTVIAATVGSHLSFVNSDELVHNVRAEGQTELFNFAMPLTGMRVTRMLPAAPGPVRLACDLHPWMRANVRVFDHPYFTITDGEGRFRLEGLPAGRQHLHFWHPRLGEAVLEVQVPRSGTGELGAVTPAFVPGAP
jgi:plastocyanin